MVEKTDRPVKGILLKIGFEGKPEKGMAVTAYAFDRKGAFITSAPVQEGQVELDISEAQGKGARFFIGPSLKGKREQKPTIKMMERFYAYEPKFVFEAKKRVYELLPIPEIDWRYWLLCPCRVRGKVVRPVTVSGTTTDMPIYHARVHVCEVDPIWLILRRVPDHIVLKIRDSIIYQQPIPQLPPESDVELPIPSPFELIPGPIFQFDTAEMDFTPGKIAQMYSVPSTELNPQPEPPEPVWRSSSAIIPGIKQYSSLFSTLPADTKAALQSRSMPTLRAALLANTNLISPFLCLWPWIWPFLYISDELAVLDTDTQGRFDTAIWYPCFGDHPDLYFWVEYCIGGTWTTVCRRPIRCSTYWNYVCGTEVIIRIKDPNVPWYGDPPSLSGKQVGIMSIGNNISIHQIQGAAAGVDKEGLTTTGQPFGGSLEPHVWFGQDDLMAAGITHYKWSYRRLVDWDTWHAMDRQVIRHYAVIDPDPPHNLTFKPSLLGPDPVYPTQNLYKFQPKDAPDGSYGWAPMIDGRENTASAFFLSHLLNGCNASAAADKYELKLELFKCDGASVNLANLTNEGVLLKVPTIDGPFGAQTVDTIDAPDEYLIKDAGKVVGFRLVLRVDNNPCDPEIYSTQVGSQTAGPCGFISYTAGNKAAISFRARHPNNFATFNFGLYRGSAGEIIDVSGSVGASPINGFTKDAGSVFSRNDLSITDLVVDCPDGAAAFAETLHMDALATDGWSTYLDHLDRDAVPMAFALKPAAP